jgi:hypothetical protein
MEQDNKIISSFYTKDTLNSEIWENHDDVENSKIKPEIRDGLLKIANEFISFLGFDIFVQDVTMTGSLANFNWSEFSDIDLHIIYDFKESGEEEELFRDLFNLKRTVFNSQHDITVKGYEVETYVQDMNEPHMSTGVYSVLYDEWLTQPKPEEVSIDKNEIEVKSKQWMNMIDTLLKDLKDDSLPDGLEKIDKLKEKIKKYRSCGLERGGEYSNENLVFKFLRRNGYIQKLFDNKNELIDKNLSIQEKISP